MIRPLVTAVILLMFCLSGTTSAQEVNHPYSIGWTVDGPLIGTAAVVAFSASSIDDKLSSLTMSELQALNKQSINPIDRITAGWYSHDQSTISDILVGGSILSPFLFAFDREIRTEIGIVSSLYLETVIFATFMPSFGKGLVKRVRPYAYGSSAPLSEKQSIESIRSFYSGHATWAFATSIFFATVYTDYHPESEYRNYVWGGAIGLATAVSILRVTSGAHFLSDIAVGAAVGTSIGYLIPYVHRTTNTSFSIHPILAPGYTGASVTFHLK